MAKLSDDIIQAEVDRVLLILRADFENCYPLVKRFSNLPLDAGIYALRGREEILYIGKSGNIRTRFQSGHRCLSDALIEGRKAENLRIAAAAIVPPELVRALERIKGRLLIVVRPSYNVLYPTREV